MLPSLRIASVFSKKKKKHLSAYSNHLSSSCTDHLLKRRSGVEEKPGLDHLFLEKVKKKKFHSPFDLDEKKRASTMGGSIVVSKARISTAMTSQSLEQCGWATIRKPSPQWGDTLQNQLTISVLVRRTLLTLPLLIDRWLC